MSNKIYYLPNSQKGLLTANGMKNYFKTMRERYPNKKQIVTFQADIDDLIYYLNCHYSDGKRIKEEIDLSNCEFFVDLPPEPRNNHFCFWVRDKDTGKSLHFSTSTKGFIPPSHYKNFCDYLKALLIPYKRKIREMFSKQEGISPNSVNLWHSEPKTEDIIDEFIQLNNLSDKLDEVISPNGLGNNVPYLMPDYEYLKEKFIDFYIDKKGLIN